MPNGFFEAMQEVRRIDKARARALEAAANEAKLALARGVTVPHLARAAGINARQVYGMVGGSSELRDPRRRRGIASQLGAAMEGPIRDRVEEIDDQDVEICWRRANAFVEDLNKVAGYSVTRGAMQVIVLRSYNGEKVLEHVLRGDYRTLLEDKDFIRPTLREAADTMAKRIAEGAQRGGKEAKRLERLAEEERKARHAAKDAS
jgi:hypothetical protein